VIEECDVEILLERELYYGIKFNVLCKKTGLNSRLPKSGEHYTYMSEDTKRKIGKKNKKINYGKKHNFYESKLKKLTVEQVAEIKKLLYENILTQKEISIKYSVSRKIISRISSGKSYSYVNEYDLSNRKPINFKLKDGDIEIIINMYNQGKTHSSIAEFFGVNQSHVTRIINKYKKGG
jgi:DNA-directed RNA polymerase specialized sigma subunit